MVVRAAESSPALQKDGYMPDSAPAYGSDAGGEVILTDAADGTAGLTEGVEDACVRPRTPAWVGIAIVMDPKTDCMSCAG